MKKENKASSDEPPMRAAVLPLLPHGEPVVLSAGLVLPDGEPLVPEQTAPAGPVVLVGRSEGRRLLPLLTERMEAMPPRSVLPIDCRDVRIIDVSYGDEAFVRLARRRTAGEYPDRYFLLANVGEELEANLQMLFEIRGIIVPFRGKGSRAPGLLGDVGPEMRETYALASEWGKITARQLIEHVGEGRLSIAASSNRVSRLAEAGALASVESEVVEGGGRQKVFAPVM